MRRRILLLKVCELNLSVKKDFPCGKKDNMSGGESFLAIAHHPAKKISTQLKNWMKNQSKLRSKHHWFG